VLEPTQSPRYGLILQPITRRRARTHQHQPQAPDPELGHALGNAACQRQFGSVGGVDTFDSPSDGAEAENHVRNILEKLQLHSRMEAVMYAVREKSSTCPDRTTRPHLALALLHQAAQRRATASLSATLALRLSASGWRSLGGRCPQPPDSQVRGLTAGLPVLTSPDVLTQQCRCG